MADDTSVREDARIRLRAGALSLVVSIILLGVKYWAYVLTGSTAILSDALESIVNVVAACFALGGLVFAGRPADRSHPYGHGKIEFFSAAFEGGLIAFAAVLILYEVAKGLWYGVEVRAIDAGAAIVLGAAFANLGLGLYLVRTGRRYESLTLVADGHTRGSSPRRWRPGSRTCSSRGSPATSGSTSISDQAAERGPSAALRSSRLPAAGTSPPHSPHRRAPCIRTTLDALVVRGGPLKDSPAKG